MAGRRHDSQQVSRVTWTLDDARRANLAGRQNWRTYPRQMLAARASAELARLIFADVIGGLAITEELDEEGAVGIGGGGADGAQETAQRRRRQRTTLRQPDRPPPSDDDEPSMPPLPGEPGYEQGEADTPSEAQVRKLHASCRERGFDRAERLDWAGRVLGRQVTSFKELSGEEVSSLLDKLEARAPVTSMEPEEPEPEPEREPERLSLGLQIFKARLAGERFPEGWLAEEGAAMFPGRALSALSDEERGQLMDALLERRAREDDAGEQGGWDG
jgi:hypothetical protein